MNTYATKSHTIFLARCCFLCTPIDSEFRASCRRVGFTKTNIAVCANEENRSLYTAIRSPFPCHSRNRSFSQSHFITVLASKRAALSFAMSTTPSTNLSRFCIQTPEPASDEPSSTPPPSPPPSPPPPGPLPWWSASQTGEQLRAGTRDTFLHPTGSPVLPRELVSEPAPKEAYSTLSREQEWLGETWFREQLLKNNPYLVQFPDYQNV